MYVDKKVIALDARTIFSKHRRGTGKNLIDLYKKIMAIKPDWNFIFCGTKEISFNPFADDNRVEVIRLTYKGHRFQLWRDYLFPLTVFYKRANVLHAPANIGPRWPLVPMVATIHDLIPLQQHLRTPASEKWGALVKRTAQKARKILTPSQYSKNEIIKFCNVPEEKIIVNPWAPDSKCRYISDPNLIEHTLKKYNISGDTPYVFGFGAEDPRKNTERVLKAWSLLPKSIQKENALLLVGIQDEALKKFRTLTKELGIDRSCHLHGFAPEEDIPPLLSGAKVLVFPSLSEGFGLPILDAFTCHTAVLTSNVTSLPEVAGDAAILVDPYKEEEIRDGLVHLLSNERARMELVEKGLERVKMYTWDACANRVIKVFEEVAST